MTKLEAFSRAKREVVMFRSKGEWAVAIAAAEGKSPRVILGLLFCTAKQYRRELVLERTLVYMGYPLAKVYSLPADIYYGADLPTLDTLIEVLESK